MTRSKYGAKPCQIGTEKYRSQKEAARHQWLLSMQKAGQITDLKREVAFLLAPGVKIEGENRARPAVRYFADFVYFTPDGRRIVEDAKGFQTPLYRLKKHLMATVFGISVREP